MQLAHSARSATFFAIAIFSFALTAAPSQTCLAQVIYPGGGTQGFPGAYRVTAGYGGTAPRGYVPGSEPAAGQLRGFPLQTAPPVVVGVPGDRSGIYRAPYVPDVTYIGPRPYAAGYRDVAPNGRRRLFRTPAGGTGLPLVNYGGFWDNRGPIEFTTPASSIFSGYYGSVAPTAPSSPVVFDEAP